ncbi:histone deacetylase 4-like isoform X5 [Ptychodera flava]|uniref:histone deacetylase 4-like isoform X5 n=1 Tax=Ptychodera flava TaxID=63121 RepID=UPI00396A960A
MVNQGNDELKAEEVTKMSRRDSPAENESCRGNACTCTSPLAQHSMEKELVSSVLLQALEQGTPITLTELLHSRGQKCIMDMQCVVYNVAKKYILENRTREGAQKVIQALPELSIGRINAIAKMVGIEPFRLSSRQNMLTEDIVAKWIHQKLCERKLLTLDILQVTFPQYYRRVLRRILYTEVWNFVLSGEGGRVGVSKQELQEMLPDIPEEVIWSFTKENQKKNLRVKCVGDALVACELKRFEAAAQTESVHKSILDAVKPEPSLGGRRDLDVNSHYSNHMQPKESNGSAHIQSPELVPREIVLDSNELNMQSQQLHEDLLRLKQQQQLQKQMLIEQFKQQQEELAKQHEKQLHDHLQVSNFTTQRILQLQKEKELLEQQARLQEQQRREQERQRQELLMKKKDKPEGHGSANASSEVKQRLQEFVLNKKHREAAASSINHSPPHHFRQWAAHHSSLEHHSPPHSGVSPPYQHPVLGQYDHAFPLRKTASDSNLKVRSRLKEKVTERRSSPLLRRRDGSSSLKRKPLSIDTTLCNSAPGSGPSSPQSGGIPATDNGNGSTSIIGAEAEVGGYPLMMKRMLGTNDVNLYTSPSLPNISLGLPASATSTPAQQPGSSTISAAQAGLTTEALLKSRIGHHFAAGHLLPPAYFVPLPQGGSADLNNSFPPTNPAYVQAQMKALEQAGMAPGPINPLLASGLATAVHPHAIQGIPVSADNNSTSPLSSGPLGRTQSAPLPTSQHIQQFQQQQQMLLQQQHQQFLQEKQQKYMQMQQQTLLKQQMRKQLRRENHVEESPEEAEEDAAAAAAASSLQDAEMKETPPPKSGPGDSGSVVSPTATPSPPPSSVTAIEVKQEPIDSDDDSHKITKEQEELEKQQHVGQMRQPPIKAATVSGSIPVNPLTRLSHCHRPLSRAQSSPAAPFQIGSESGQFSPGDQPVKHMFTTGLAYDSLMQKHQCTCGNNSLHPEHAGRLQSIWARFQETGIISRCERIKSRKATLDEIQSCHREGYTLFYGTNPLNRQKIDSKKLAGMPKISFTVLPCGGFGLDSDTVWNDLHTSSAARMAAGCVIELAFKVAAGELKNGFAVVRPPGHHAEPNQAMGFCFFNSVAIAAKQLRQKLKLEKILILDWDVHHGNSTQKIFYEDPHVLYISMHRHDDGNFFPGTGAPDECGSGPGLGYNVNIAFHGGVEPPMGDADYIAAFRTIVMPIAREFSPDIVLVSAGFDAAMGHPAPLGGYQVTPACFGWMTKKLMTLAGGRVVLALEGGYDLAAICDCSEVCSLSLLGDDVALLSEEAMHKPPCGNAIASIERCVKIQSEFWPSVRRWSNTVSYSMVEASKREKEEADTVTALASLSMGVQSTDTDGSEPMEEEETSPS